MTSNVRRTSFLPFARPDLDHRELDAVREVLDSGWLTSGPKARAFEEAFGARVGSRHAIAVNSCTAALHLALDAIGLRAGDEVITTPYTFAASGEVIRYFDARPVFVDIDPRTLNIDPALISSAITPKTRAVLVVHMGGLPVDLDSIHETAGRHGLAVIEDAAHAFLAGYKGRPIGALSDFTCFSFYATKTITTGEGGMICTNDDAQADRCRRMSLHGLSRTAWTRYERGGSWRYDIEDAGYKYNMTDVAAAMGLVQLQKAASMRERRERIAAQYDQAFSELQDLVEAPPRDGHSTHAWHLYALRLKLDRLGISRDALLDLLAERGIGTSVHFIPLHLHSYYARTYGYRADDYPHATAEFEREVSLPIYSRMTDSDVRDVITAVTDLVWSHRR